MDNSISDKILLEAENKLTEKKIWDDLEKNIENIDEKNNTNHLHKQAITLHPGKFDLRTQHLEVLPGFLKKHPNVTILKIKNFSFNGNRLDNQFRDDNKLLESIADLKIDELYITNCNLGSKEAKILSKSKVTRLHLPSNHITNEGAKAIIKNMSLVDLDLTNNNIDPKELNTFIEDIKNKKIELKISQECNSPIKNDEMKIIQYLTETKLDANDICRELVFKIEQYILNQPWKFNHFWNGKKYTTLENNTIKLPNKICQQMDVIKSAKLCEQDKKSQPDGKRWINVLNTLITMNQSDFTLTKSPDPNRVKFYGLFLSNHKKDFCREFGIEKKDYRNLLNYM